MKMKNLIFISLFWISSSFAGVAVVANSDAGVKKITKSKLKSFWARDKQKWDNGTKVKLIDNKSGIKKAFYGHLGKSQKSYKKKWMKLQLSGKGRGAKAVSDDSAVISKVKSTSGAIGFVDEAAAKSSGLTVLMIIK
jgi:ABC-type phosphate transport system substrate-binding protein